MELTSGLAAINLDGNQVTITHRGPAAASKGQSAATLRIADIVAIEHRPATMTKREAVRFLTSARQDRPLESADPFVATLGSTTKANAIVGEISYRSGAPVSAWEGTATSSHASADTGETQQSAAGERPSNPALAAAFDKALRRGDEIRYVDSHRLVSFETSRTGLISLLVLVLLAIVSLGIVLFLYLAAGRNKHGIVHTYTVRPNGKLKHSQRRV